MGGEWARGLEIDREEWGTVAVHSERLLGFSMNEKLRQSLMRCIPTPYSVIPYL